MYPLFETIKCENGKLFHLSFHNERMNRARKELFGTSRNIFLEETIKIPEECKQGLFRCRLSYSEEIEKVEFIPHQYRTVKSLKLVENDEIDYHLKYADRSFLQQLFEQRKECDDILIVKNGCITDSFTANVVFFDGTKWWTPDTPLLKGTQRERLLSKKLIHSCRVTPQKLPDFLKVGLINAMQNLKNMPLINIKEIKSDG